MNVEEYPNTVTSTISEADEFSTSSDSQAVVIIPFYYIISCSYLLRSHTSDPNNVKNKLLKTR